MTNSEARKRNHAAQTPQQPHQPIEVVSVDGFPMVRCSCPDEHNTRWSSSVWLEEHWPGTVDEGIAALEAVVARQKAAHDAQQPHQQPNAPGVDSGAIGRLTEALAPFVRCGERYCESFDNGNRGCADCCARVIVVAALVDKHVTAALAEVESGIRRWDASSATPVKPYDHGVRRGMRHAADYVRDYREGVGR